eukprot:maker-scaffold_14-snap-gene-3.18-mRNA-1 protein AED:0.00 eAED:0.00 QI:80/1/1/1/0/0/2/1347/105
MDKTFYLLHLAPCIGFLVLSILTSLKTLLIFLVTYPIQTLLYILDLEDTPLQNVSQLLISFCISTNFLLPLELLYHSYITLSVFALLLLTNVIAQFLLHYLHKVE